MSLAYKFLLVAKKKVEAAQEAYELEERRAATALGVTNTAIIEDRSYALFSKILREINSALITFTPPASPSPEEAGL